MKIAISYPPIFNALGQKAMVSQNRNVQYFKKPTYLLPVIHAQAASSLLSQGYEVYWDDGNSQLKSYEEWFLDLVKQKPDVIVLESTTPVIKFVWETIDKIKVQLSNTIIVMTGYHSMKKPEETLLNSKTDIVLKSNHIDFALNNLVKLIDSNKNWRDNFNIGGFCLRNSKNELIDTGNFKQVEPISSSTLINRDLVGWQNYAFENGNFLRTPGTYASSVIRDCMFGKCSFCRYNGPEMTFSKMSVKKSVDEYEDLILNHGVKEIFDDSGVWFRGKDARDFAEEIIKRNLHKKGCYFGFNTRFEYLDKETIKLLAKANFRFVLIGLESGDDETLQLLNKGYSRDNILKSLKWMSELGLHPHLTIMVGYYWETEEMLNRTIELVRHIMFSGLARTLQVTLCTPLDYTPYHQDVIDKKILLTDNYDDHDMSKIIVKTPISHEIYYKAVKEIYSIAFHPKFVLRQILFLFKFRKRDWEFLFIYGYRAIRRVNQHIFNLTRNLK